MAAAVQINFQVGGVKDVERAFRSIEQLALRSETSATRGAQRSGKARATEAEKAAKAEVQAAAKTAREAQRLDDKRVREQIALYKKGDRELNRIREQSMREAIRMQDREEREKDRNAQRWLNKAENDQKARAKKREAIGRSIGSAIGRDVGSATRGAVGMAGQVLQLGGGFGIADSVQKNARAAGKAADIANSGQIFGDESHPERAIRKDPKEITGAARAIGTEFGIDQDTALSGLEKFVGKTGDLKTGLELMKGLAQTSRATGSSFEDMADAAGDVFNTDTAQSAASVADTMRNVAAQGKLGAVEMKNLAVQMAKIGAASGSFGGNAKENVMKMGALAQAARGSGGAANAANAATAVLGFAATFDKSAREKAFQSFGVKTRDQGGKVRSPDQVIKEAMHAAGDAKHGGMGNFSVNMGKMFMDKTAREVTKPF
jgi:hypothetical protein